MHADILSIPDCSPRRTARACAPPARARIQTHPDADGRGRRRRPLEFFLTRASILYWNPVLIQDVPDFPEIRHHPTYGRCTCDHLCTPTPESHCDGLSHKYDFRTVLTEYSCTYRIPYRAGSLPPVWLLKCRTGVSCTSAFWTLLTHHTCRDTVLMFQTGKSGQGRP